MRTGGLAVDALGIVFLTEVSKEVVIRLDANGAEVARWGSDRTLPGWFERPWYAATDGEGNVYVTDYNRIQKFDRMGVLLTDWVAEMPYGIAVDGNGRVFVTSGMASEALTVYTDTGGLVASWTLNEAGLGLDWDRGNLFVAQNASINKYDSEGDLVESWATPSAVRDVAVAPDGTVFAIRDVSPSILVLSSEGQLIRTWHGGAGRGIDVDEDGFVYVMAYLGPFRP